MVCMTLYFHFGEAFAYDDVSSFIFFSDVVKHGISVADGFGYESFEENVIEFFSRNCLYQG